MIKPITPDEVKHVIPDFVIKTVNKLITEKWNGKEAIIIQNDIIDEILNNYPDEDKPSRYTIFESHWLDFEPLYRKAGWNVTYRKPAFDENFKSYFKFTKNFGL